MTIAVVSLALIVVALGGAVVWAIREARAEGRLAIASGKSLLHMRKLEADLAAERDLVRADFERQQIELNTALAQIDALRVLLSESRAEVADARRKLPTDPADVSRVVDEQLQARRRSVTGRYHSKTDSSRDKIAVVPRSGPPAIPTRKPGGDPKP